MIKSELLFSSLGALILYIYVQWRRDKVFREADSLLGFLQICVRQ